MNRRWVSPHPAIWVAAVAACAVTAWAGNWQYAKARSKQQWQVAQSAAESSAPAELPAGAAPPAEASLHVRVAGEYLADRQLLLDNQTRDGRQGWHVWTPLRRADGGVVLVDRGWLPQAPDRSLPPDLSAPAGSVELHGLWRALPRPGLALAAADCTATAPFPRIVHYPQPRELGCLFDAPLGDGLLLLDPQVAGGYAREWRIPGLSPERHLGYAVQWFALCATVAVLFLVLNLKKR